MTKDSTRCSVAFSLMLLIAGCGGGSSSSPSPQQTPTPTPGGSFAPADATASMNEARAFAVATLLRNGQVLIAGGINNSGYLASVDLYDPATNTFAPAGATPTMNQARESPTATLLPNGQVLIAGGENSTAGILNSVDLYNPATNSFAPAASLPTMNIARFGAKAVLLSNGKVLIAGGEGTSAGNTTPLDSVELYDPATNSFAAAVSLPTMNELRDASTGTLLSNGKVLIAGGFEGSLNVGTIISDSVDLYDPITNSFAPAASLPTMNAARAGAAATLLPSGEVLIAGGLSQEISPPPNSSTTLASVDLYDSVTNTFAPSTSTPVMNQARAGATATSLDSGLVLIAGGADNSSILASVELYDPANNSFAPAASTPVMNQARTGATATLLINGKVLIAGGTEVSSGALSSTELYTPAPPPAGTLAN